MWRGASISEQKAPRATEFDMKNKKIDHEKRARKAWKYLVKLAQSGETTTYGEVAGRQGLHHRSAQWFLGVIQRECRQRGLPPLQALVVNKRTGRPGGGYVASARSGRGYRKAVRAVQAYKWSKAAPF